VSGAFLKKRSNKELNAFPFRSFNEVNA